MTADETRMAAYVTALRSALRPGAVVLDIGTGTGIFALLACKFGASRVYAVEPDSAIHLAKEIARANGYADRIEFIQELSTQISLPERADVVISDLRGILPLSGLHIPDIVDARQRFLAPGGTMIAQRDILWASIAATPASGRLDSSLDGDDYGFDMSAATRMAVNTPTKFLENPKKFLVEPKIWAILEYDEICQPDVRADITWTATSAGTGDGLCLWFDTETAEGVGFSNEPSNTKSIYGCAFFPWSETVDLNVGDNVLVSLEARLIDDDYIWRWSTRIFARDRGRTPKAEFMQSNFFGAALSPHKLELRTSSYVPTLAEEGEIARLVLLSMDGSTSLGDIAHKVAESFPMKFTSQHEALKYVGNFTKTYTL